MSIPWYTKNRSIQITDIVGQERIVNFIKKQAENDSFGHAYLFSGQFGSGKTSIARILAALMTCENRKKHLVCGKCRSCIAIHDGHCVDVYEVDAASKRGIDDARKIRETAYYAPQEFKKKIYVIDECHMLTNEAWNAMLKIIEEPPPYVVFIFCTTDHRKVPLTIMSRCQRFVFTQIANQDIVAHLRKIAKDEKVTIDDASLLNIARVSRGSMRDAIGNLEQLSIALNNNIKTKDTLNYFGVPDDNVIYEMIQCIANNDASGLLGKVDVLIQSGVEIKTILSDISRILRNVFIYQICGADSKLLNIIEQEKDAISKIGEKIDQSSLVKIAGSFGRIEKDINFNINDRWILEAALINCLLLLRK